MRYSAFSLTAVALLTLLAFGCDDFSHDGIVNTPPANYVNLLGAITAGGDLGDTGYGVLPFPGGGYLMVGATSSWGYGDSSLYLAHMTASGGMQWEKFFGGWGHDHGVAVTEMSGGNYLIAGTTSSIDLFSQRKIDPASGTDFDYEDLNIYLAMVNAEGTTWWEKALGDTSYLERGTGLVPVGADFLVSGVRERGSTDALTLTLVDSEGVSLRQTSYPVPASDVYGQVVATVDGNFILGGSGRYASPRGHDPVFIKVDAGGTLVWQKSFGWADSHEKIFGVVADGNGAVACGLSEQYRGTDSAAVLLYLLKVDQAGTLVWEHTFDQTGINEGRDLIRKPDGSFLVCGQNQSISQIDICKVSGSGILQWSDNTGVTGEAISMASGSRGYAIAGWNYQPGITNLTDALFLEFAEDLTNIE